MKFHLLTHPRELKRPTNSGAVVLKVLGGEEARQICWDRVRPDREILTFEDCENAVLVYQDPGVPEMPPPELPEGIEHFVLLDGTWQEARKMYNKSPYLKNMKRFVLRPEQSSLYNIRRNQTDGGLCTAECVIELLKLKLDKEKAENLLIEFRNFLKEMISRAAYRHPGQS